MRSSRPPAGYLALKAHGEDDHLVQLRGGRLLRGLPPGGVHLLLPLPLPLPLLLLLRGRRRAGRAEGVPQVQGPARGVLGVG
jgi:hypothetical protein